MSETFSTALPGVVTAGFCTVFVSAMSIRDVNDCNWDFPLFPQTNGSTRIIYATQIHHRINPGIKKYFCGDLLT